MTKTHDDVRHGHPAHRVRDGAFMKHSTYLGCCDRAQGTRRQSPCQDCDRFHPKTVLIQSFETWTILRMEVVKETGALGWCMTSGGECGGGGCRGE
eukprot:692446-Amphidinium_carterae.1